MSSETPPTPPPPTPPPPPPEGAGSPPPDGSDSGGSGGSGGGTDVGMQPNVAGLLCYAPCCVGLIMSVVAALVEKKSDFVRFHAFQSLLLHAAGLVLWIASWVLTAAVSAVAAPLGFLVWLLTMLAGLALLVLMIFLMVRAYNGEELSLPYVGPMARQWV